MSRQILLVLVLVFLGFGVDVSEDVDVREVDPEPAEQRGHSEGYTPARKEQTAQSKNKQISSR